MSILRVELETETWGDRLRRARERSETPLRDAAARISRWEPASRQRLLNLEDLREAPTDVGRRIVALLAAVAYGYDPAVFDLSWDDLPRRIDQAEVIGEDELGSHGP
jgi:hypothetical protein